MTLAGPIALATMYKIAAVLGGLTVVAYILKLRRRRYEVPFSKLWHRVLREKESSSLWRRLKRLLSLLVQLAFLALLLGAVVDPRIGQASPAGRNVVIIIDASASMKAQDGGVANPMRIDHAKDKARQILKGMGGADVAMLVRMDGQTSALSVFDSDVPHLLKVVDGVEASDTPADLPRALQAAADALRGRRNPLIVIIGDGAYRDDAKNDVMWEAPSEAQKVVDAAGNPPIDPENKTEAVKLGMPDLRGIEVTFVPIGKTPEQVEKIKQAREKAADLEAQVKASPTDAALKEQFDLAKYDLAKLAGSRNVGIVSFNVRRYFQNKLSYEVLVEIQNFSIEPETVKFTLFAGTEAVDVKVLELKGGERIRKIYPDLGGGDERNLTAKLSLEPKIDPETKATILGPDEFALDDVAYALLPLARKQKVLLVTADNLYLEGALLLDSNITVDKVPPLQYPTDLAAGKLNGYDVVVYDNFTPAENPPAPSAIYFAPSGDRSPIPIRGDLKRPFITDVEKNHPVTRWVTLSDVNIDHSAVFSPGPGDTTLASSIRDPIIVAGKRTGRKFLAFGFGLDGTDLMLRVAFPVLIVNALDWFAGDDAELLTTYRTGHTWHIPVDATSDVREAVIFDPTKHEIKAPVLESRASFYGRYVGLYKVEVPNSEMEPFFVAANLSDPLESNIAPATELVLGGKKLADPPTFTATVSRAVWIWLVLAGLVLSSIEWLTYNRRITV